MNTRSPSSTPGGGCREVFQKRGLDLHDRIQRLHVMVHAVVHIQQFVNKRRLRYRPFGPWNHFQDEIFDQLEVEPNTDSSESSSSSSDDSRDENGTSCSDNPCEDDA